MERTWTLIELHDFVKDEDRLNTYLTEKRLIQRQLKCPTCGKVMTLSGDFWRCQKLNTINKMKVKCQTKISVNKGTWFSQSKLSHGQILKLTYMLVKNDLQIRIAEELKLSLPTVSLWMQYVRQVFLDWSLCSSEVIGGVGKVVEIDESKFGKRKYNRGHHVEGQWIFGGVERESGKLFMVPVQDRSAATLITVIKQWIEPGTTIVSDCWKAYDGLEAEGYTHLKVNHSLNFVDPDSKEHTNTIESSWRHAKRFIPQYCRRNKDYAAYLAHFMFTKKAKSDGVDILELFLDEVARMSFDWSEMVDCIPPEEIHGEDTMANCR